MQCSDLFIVDLTSFMMQCSDLSIVDLTSFMMQCSDLSIVDLTSFMMQCSDLSAPKAAKGFVKPTVAEVQPKRGKTITYQPSQKSRTWTGDTGRYLQRKTSSKKKKKNIQMFPPERQLKIIMGVMFVSWLSLWHPQEVGRGGSQMLPLTSRHHKPHNASAF